MKKKFILGAIITIFTVGCNQNNQISCSSVLNQFNKHNYQAMYAEKGFERVANVLKINEYQKEFEKKLTYYTSDLIENRVVVQNPYIHRYCNELYMIKLSENNQTKLRKKISKVKEEWLDDYNATISSYKFKPIVYIKDRKCKKIAKKLNDFYLNKELGKKRGSEQFKVAIKPYQKCIETVIAAGNKGDEK